MPYTRPQLVGYWQDAIQNDAFVSYRHHPSGLATLDKTRSILTQDMFNNLSSFFGSGCYSIAHYSNNFHPATPDYFVVIPKDTAFSVPGSGVLATSPRVLWPCDRLVIVSGHDQGWHVFAELSSNIKLAQANGTLSFNTAL